MSSSVLPVPHPFRSPCDVRSCPLSWPGSPPDVTLLSPHARAAARPLEDNVEGDMAAEYTEKLVLLTDWLHLEPNQALSLRSKRPAPFVPFFDMYASG
jgi:hypothetical protein